MRHELTRAHVLYYVTLAVGLIMTESTHGWVGVFSYLGILLAAILYSAYAFGVDSIVRELRDQSRKRTCDTIYFRGSLTETFQAEDAEKKYLRTVSQAPVMMKIYVGCIGLGSLYIYQVGVLKSFSFTWSGGAHFLAAIVLIVSRSLVQRNLGLLFSGFAVMCWIFSLSQKGAPLFTPLVATAGYFLLWSFTWSWLSQSAHALREGLSLPIRHFSEELHEKCKVVGITAAVFAASFTVLSWIKERDDILASTVTHVHRRLTRATNVATHITQSEEVENATETSSASSEEGRPSTEQSRGSLGGSPAHSDRRIGGSEPSLHESNSHSELAEQSGSTLEQKQAPESQSNLPNEAHAKQNGTSGVGQNNGRVANQRESSQTSRVQSGEPLAQKQKVLFDPDKLKFLIGFLRIVFYASIVAGTVYLLSRWVQKPMARPKIEKPRISKEERDRLRRELKALNTRKLSMRDEVIERYHFFLKTMGSLSYGREDWLPTTDYYHRLNRKFPKIQSDLWVITHTFNDTLYGSYSVDEPRLQTYRKAIQSVLSHFI